jgi:hypothetical protein
MAALKRFDTLLTGLIPGLLLPLLTVVVMGIASYEGELNEFFSTSYRMRLLSKILTLAAIPNLLLFFLFIWTNRNYSARGVIFATLLVALVMLVLKFA